MATIQRIVASTDLNTERGSMPHPQITNALGNAIEGLGSSMSTLFAKMQQRKEQTEDTNTNIEWQKMQAGLASQMDERAQSMAPDGAGFHDSFMEQVYTPARSKFLAGVPERTRAKWEKILEENGLDQNDWSTKAAVRERDQSYNWARDQITVTTDNLKGAINLDPDAYKGLLQSGYDFIDGTPLPAAEKIQRKREWEHFAQIAHLDRMVESGRYTEVLSDLHADINSLPPTRQFSVIANVVEQIESGGDDTAVSGAGAAGRMQVMPSTAREIAAEMKDGNFRPNMSDDEVRRYLSNPAVGRAYGEFYLKKQLRTFGPRGGVNAALVAYNAGPAVAEAWIKSGFDDSKLPKETQGYLKKFARLLPGMAGAPTSGGAGQPQVKVTWAGQARNRVLRDGKSTEDVNPELIKRATSTWAALGLPELKITSGYRDRDENTRVKGARESQHLHANAIDIDVAGYSRAQRLEIIRGLSSAGIGGIGVGSNIIHADLGPRRAWGYGAGPHGGSPPPDWAAPAIAEHLNNTARISTGAGAASDIYASLPYSDRQKYIAHASAAAEAQYTAGRQASVADRVALQSDIANDLASVANTGASTREIDPATIADKLGEEAMYSYLRNRDEAQHIFAAKDGIATMDDSEMDQRLLDLTPDAEGGNFVVQQKAFAAAAKEVERVRSLRGRNPTMAAFAYSDVQDAYKAFANDPKNPETAQAYVKATLERQREFGIKTESQQPLPNAALLEIAKSLQPPPGPVRAEEIKTRIALKYQELQKVFGDYADEIIIAAMAEYHGMTTAQADAIVAYMTAIQNGGDPFELKRAQSAADAEADNAKLGSYGLLDRVGDFFRGSSSKSDSTADEPAGAKSLSTEERIRLQGLVDGASEADLKMLRSSYGDAAVDAALRVYREQ